jgi:hypothetical protein
VPVTAPPLGPLHTADVVALAVEFPQSIDHVVKGNNATGTRHLP